MKVLNLILYLCCNRFISIYRKWWVKYQGFGLELIYNNQECSVESNSVYNSLVSGYTSCQGWKAKLIKNNQEWQPWNKLVSVETFNHGWSVWILG